MEKNLKYTGKITYVKVGELVYPAVDIPEEVFTVLNFADNELIDIVVAEDKRGFTITKTNMIYREE